MFPCDRRIENSYQHLHLIFGSDTYESPLRIYSWKYRRCRFLSCCLRRGNVDYNFGIYEWSRLPCKQLKLCVSKQDLSKCRFYKIPFCCFQQNSTIKETSVRYFSWFSPHPSIFHSYYLLKKYLPLLPAVLKKS